MIQNSGNFHLVKLENPVKQYAWGRTNKDCSVGRLSGKENYKNYAELWMGVHCNGQSLVKTNQNPIKLSQYLRKNAYNSIQFLYKVLSIEKCLSLQVHPNKQQAIKWNSQRPHIYADNNDKPQMFYTLDEFQCFFGYVSTEEFIRICDLGLFKQFFQFKHIKTPKDMIIQILKLGQKEQQQLLAQCLNQLQKIHPTRYNADTKNRKIWRIHEDFPHDIGVVVSFFLAYKILPKGACYYIESNMPHAYIYGQCLQIMKNSDNVCRLGLTPKLKDLEVMDQALGDYFGSSSPVEPIKSTGSSNRVISESYKKQGLQLLIITFKQKSEKDYQNQGASLKQKLVKNKRTRICLIVEGVFRIREQGDLDKEQILKVGDVVIIKEDKQYTIERVEEEEDGRGLVCLGWSSF